MSSTGPDNPGRLAHLDGIRGVAALVVAVFWHWQHFSNGKTPVEEFPFFSIAGLPFFAVFYKYGYLAVDLFFIISGLIFSHVYAGLIERREVSFRLFFLRRIARLYPLHFLGLLLFIVFGSFVYFKFGYYPIYQNFDLFHLALNIFFLQKGFFDAGYSFNGPSWSLSVELFLYFLFFFFVWAGRLVAASLAAVCVGLLVGVLQFKFPFLLNAEIARGLVGFFWGVLLARLLVRAASVWVIFLLGVLAIVILMKTSFLSDSVIQYPIALVVFTQFLVLSFWLKFVRALFSTSFLIYLGEISLSIYLTHVPLQLMFIVLFGEVNSGSGAIWVLYFGVVILMAGLARKFVEIPGRALILRCWKSADSRS